jgi:hypothetical protein
VTAAPPIMTFAGRWFVFLSFITASISGIVVVIRAERPIAYIHSCGPSYL